MALATFLVASKYLAPFLYFETERGSLLLTMNLLNLET